MKRSLLTAVVLSLGFVGGIYAQDTDSKKPVKKKVVDTSTTKINKDARKKIIKKDGQGMEVHMTANILDKSSTKGLCNNEVAKNTIVTKNKGQKMNVLTTNETLKPEKKKLQKSLCNNEVITEIKLADSNKTGSKNNKSAIAKPKKKVKRKKKRNNKQK